MDYLQMEEFGDVVTQFFFQVQRNIENPIIHFRNIVGKIAYIASLVMKLGYMVAAAVGIGLIADAISGGGLVARSTGPRCWTPRRRLDGCSWY